MSRCQSDISMASTLLIQAYKSAHTSIIDRLSIEFASALHRICIGFATEDHWRNNGALLERLTDSRLNKRHPSPRFQQCLRSMPSEISDDDTFFD